MVDKNNFDWKKYITECLESTDFCCLATIDPKNGVWANPVYFAWDSKFNLFFISQPQTRHMQNIVKNQRVAVAIYKTEQKGDIFGVQLEGVAKILTKAEDKVEANKIYYGRVGSLKQNEPFIDNPDWEFVKIIPKGINYFNSEIFDEQRQEVPMDKLKT